MFERFTRSARTVVVDAQGEARRLRHRRVDTEHLLLALLRHGDGAAGALRDVGVTVEMVEATIERKLRDAPGSLGDEDAAALRSIGVDLAEVRARLEENFGPDPLTFPNDEPRRWFGLRRRHAAVYRTGCHLTFTPQAKKVLELSLREALRLRHRHIGPEHMLLGLLRANGGLAAVVLTEAGVDVADLRHRAEATLRQAAA